MHSECIAFRNEEQSNDHRRDIQDLEPRSLRTFTPTLAVLDRSAGSYHWTVEGRQLYDYTSGVLVANLGHNPRAWLERLFHHLGWDNAPLAGTSSDETTPEELLPFVSARPLTAYNATTPLESETCRRLLANLHASPGSQRLEQILWAASGSEAIQKALWAALHHNPEKDIILATRHGFHGKKGLAGACTGSEESPNRDPRVQFVTFPTDESSDVTNRTQPFDPAPYQKELESLKQKHGSRLSCLITEPYLGGAGSFHPPTEYLQLLQSFCRENQMLFILDEVQSNFGRTGAMYAFETYGLEPDIVVLGKGMGNGAPVAAAVGSAAILGSMEYGEASDTYSANPLCCAAVLATLEVFESTDVIGHARRISAIIEEHLLDLKHLQWVAHIRGEGMVWGVELSDFQDRSSSDVANACVRACYLGDSNGRAIHLMGPLAGNVLRISPPLTISETDARESLGVFCNILSDLW